MINNRGNNNMLESLKKSLHQSEKVDILTAFFYFSGFNELAEELKDKKIRILVGKTIDPNKINELSRYVDDPNEDLATYGVGGWNRLNNSQKKKYYTDSFISMFNKSPLSGEFDSTNGQAVFKMFLNKIKNGTLEIRLTNEPNHAKAYILTNKTDYSCFGDQKGIVFTGSSNFTYNGLLGQGEINERFSDNSKYNEYSEEFERLWNDSKTIDICVKDGNNDFENHLKNNLWIFAAPTPYQIFIRILYEMYNSIDKNNIKTPSEITNNKFSDFKYQSDAIKYGVDCINKNNGVIIADVVGLGKSVIASAIAYNLDMKTVILAPPHLKEQWEKYQRDFKLRGCQVWSSGKIKEEVYDTYASDPDPVLYIIDEAHRYRNELSETYQKLHQLTRSNAKNKVILLTATPYNNRPQDLFALIKLFQTPSRSTINSVNNLSMKFNELILEYQKLEKENKNNSDNNALKPQFEQLSQKIRALIDPVMIRRSRIDLKNIKEYQRDLELQNIKFPEIIGPNLIEYNLGSIQELYCSTLEELENKFKCARYSPTNYLVDPKKFNKDYKELFNENGIEQAQRNLAEFMKRLLVMRFESSQAAFKSTLNNILEACKNIKRWWDKGYVPIKKSGYLPNPDEYEIQEMVNKIDSIIDGEIDISELSKKDAIPIPKEIFSEDFIQDVESDIQTLSDISKKWFGNTYSDKDPKYSEVKSKISSLITENSDRKIVIFSSFADTAEYVYKKLQNDGFRTMLYKGGASATERNNVTENFDASCDISKQKNDFDIIVATDALSEGFNLNRAGIIINYDIPYNPTRVIQRIGRINRINKKMFDKIYIFNFFPTVIGEDTIKIKQISTLKMFLINNIIGSDTKTLTRDEDLKSYFEESYKNADEENNCQSWDVKYKNIYDSIKNNKEFIDSVLTIPERVRIVRKTSNGNTGSVLFAKRGSNALFGAIINDDVKAKMVSPEIALNLFKASPEEKGFECDEELDKKFALIRDEIQKPFDIIPSDSKRRIKAIDNLEALNKNISNEKDYISDLLEVIKDYDDLSDGEIKFLANLKMLNSNETINIIKEKISVHYINQIKQKAESINSEPETILFNEDIRNANG